ncbi:MAG: sigma 54-interacting transcriptional regulator, partial [Blastocatellia bacterium]
LRVLQEKEYRSLGSTRIRKVDVRFVAATNVDTETAVESGRLRRDIYYRLNVIPLRLPPLREREGDAPLLADHFLKRYAAEFGKPNLTLSSEAAKRLVSYDWPGNVRELENLIERSVALSSGKVIRASDLDLPSAERKHYAGSFRAAKERFIEQFECDYIRELLRAHQGNVTKAAQAAEKNRRAFWELMRKHHIDARHFKPAK